MSATKTEKREFIQQYIETARWSSNDTERDTPIAYHLTDDTEYAGETIRAMIRDGLEFLRVPENVKLIEDCLDDFSMAGHDYWLTRCGHGAGFWDGDWPVSGDTLAEVSKKMGARCLFVGDDGLIYIG